MDTEKLLDEYRELIDFTELFWTLTEENVDEILDKSLGVVKEGLISYYTLSDMINSFSSRNLKQVRAIIKFITLLFAKVSDFSFPPKYKFYNELIHLILHLKYGNNHGISKYDFMFTDENEYRGKTTDEIIDIYYRDKIEKSIIFDDIQALQKNSSENNISFNNKMLHMAARNGSIDCFKYLLLNGCSIDQTTYEQCFLGNSYEIIHLCEENCQTNNTCIKNAVLGHHNETVRYILDKYEIDYTWEQTMFTYNFDLFFDKIQRSSIIDERDEKNDTCLMVCVRYNLVSIARSLLRDFNANPNEIMTNFLNYPMIVYACSKQWNEMLEVLVEYKANSLATTDSGKSAVWFALDQHNFQALKILQKSEGFVVDYQDDQKRTPLINFVIQNNIESVKYLLEIGANVNAFDKSHKTPLIHSIRKAYYPIFQLLLAAGADVNFPGKQKNTALFYAAEYSSWDMLKDLIDHGADVNQANSYNETPIFMAAKNNFEFGIKLLLEKGAKIDIVTKDKSTLLMAACQGESMFLIKYCVEHGLNVNAINNEGKTPLIYSLLQASRFDVQYLLTNGADPNLGSENKKPLYYAINGSFFNLLRQYGAK